MYIGDNGWSPRAFSRQTQYKRIGSERKFGVELEYNDIPESALDLEGRTVFGAKEDCSVDGGEFYSPILYGDQGLAECEKFCEQAAGMNFVPGRGAGFHLHIDMRGESFDALKSIALGYHYTRPFWLSIVEPYRRDYSYSHPERYDHQRVLNLESQDSFRSFARGYGRYNWANWLAYGDHGSLELRPHESTIEGDDVIHWVIGHTRFADAMAECSVGRITRLFSGNKTVNQLFREMRAILRNPDTSEHYAERFRRWATAA